MSLFEIRNRKHPHALCEECPLYDQPYVPSAGPINANLVVVGEAPGKQEVDQSQPFVGKSGQFLRDHLNDLGIDSDMVRYTNTVACRPPGNRTPTRVEIGNCAPRMLKDINEVGPDHVLALGAVAGKAVMGTAEGITSLRVGRPRESKLVPGAKVIPTFHPAAIFRKSDYYASFKEDLHKLLYYPDEWMPPDYMVYDSFTQVEGLRSRLTRGMKHPMLVVDVESTFDKALGNHSPLQQDLMCIGLSDGPNEVVVIGKELCQNPDGWVDAFRKLLNRSNIIAHNGKFDLLALRRLGKFDLAFDTMLAHYCLDERRGHHSLQQISMEMLGAPDWKEVTSRYSRWEDIPEPTLYQYNAYDVANTYRLYELLVTWLEAEDGLESLLAFLVRSSNTLTDMEYQGLRVDVSQIGRLQAGFEEELQRLRVELNMVAGMNHNPNSVKDVKEKVLPTRFGVRLESTKAAVLEELIEKTQSDGLELYCRTLLQYREIHKLQSVYVRGLTERVRNNRVYSSFLLHGTVTGRLASRNPNLQNIPRNDHIKSVFVPEPGNWLVQCDYRQAELRAMAWLAQDEFLQGVLIDESRDLHSEVAEQLFGPDFTKEDRHRAKAVVFGVNYGMGAPYLAAMLKISKREAERYISEWFKMIPQTDRWMKELERRVLETGVVQSPFGHKRRFGHIGEGNRKSVLKEARAFLPQNVASNICLQAANRVRDAGLGDQLRILVHDAIIFETKQDDLSTIRKVCDIMEDTGYEYLQGFVTAPVDAAAGPSWGELKEVNDG